MGDREKNVIPCLKDVTGNKYQEWKKLLAMWRRITKVPKENQCSYVVLSAIENSEAKTVGLSLTDEQVSDEDGLDTLLLELDKVFQKDVEARGYDLWLKLKAPFLQEETIN